MDDKPAKYQWEFAWGPGTVRVTLNGEFFPVFCLPHLRPDPGAPDRQILTLQVVIKPDGQWHSFTDVTPPAGKTQMGDWLLGIDPHEEKGERG